MRKAFPKYERGDSRLLWGFLEVIKSPCFSLTTGPTTPRMDSKVQHRPWSISSVRKDRGSTEGVCHLPLKRFPRAPSPDLCSCMLLLLMCCLGSCLWVKQGFFSWAPLFTKDQGELAPRGHSIDQRMKQNGCPAHLAVEWAHQWVRWAY